MKNLRQNKVVPNSLNRHSWNKKKKNTFEIRKRIETKDFDHHRVWQLNEMIIKKRTNNSKQNRSDWRNAFGTGIQFDSLDFLQLLWINFVIVLNVRLHTMSNGYLKINKDFSGNRILLCNTQLESIFFFCYAVSFCIVQVYQMRQIFVSFRFVLGQCFWSRQCNAYHENKNKFVQVISSNSLQFTMVRTTIFIEFLLPECDTMLSYPNLLNFYKSFIEIDWKMRK